MLSSNLCCRFETVPHCEKKRSTSPPEVGCVIKNSTRSWNGEARGEGFKGYMCLSLTERVPPDGAVANCPAGSMHMQTCKHANMQA